jgi:hypothetical protein
MRTRSPQGCPTGGVEQSGSCPGASGLSWPDYVQLRSKIARRSSASEPRCSIPPEVLEPIRRQRRVDRGAGDRPMSQPALNRPGVVAFVGQRVAAGVAQHVRVGLQLQPGGLRGALDHAGEAGRGEWRAALADEDESGKDGIRGNGRLPTVNAQRYYMNAAEWLLAAERHDASSWSDTRNRGLLAVVGAPADSHGRAARVLERVVLARDHPIEPMTLGNMRDLGVRSLAFRCHRCHRERTMNADHLPGAVTVPSFIPRMVCTSCGIVGADAQPNWKDQQSRES